MINSSNRLFCTGKGQRQRKSGKKNQFNNYCSGALRLTSRRRRSPVSLIPSERSLYIVTVCPLSLLLKLPPHQQKFLPPMFPYPLLQILRVCTKIVLPLQPDDSGTVPASPFTCVGTKWPTDSPSSIWYKPTQLRSHACHLLRQPLLKPPQPQLLLSQQLLRPLVICFAFHLSKTIIWPALLHVSQTFFHFSGQCPEMTKYPLATCNEENPGSTWVMDNVFIIIHYWVMRACPKRSLQKWMASFVNPFVVGRTRKFRYLKWCGQFVVSFCRCSEATITSTSVTCALPGSLLHLVNVGCCIESILVPSNLEVFYCSLSSHMLSHAVVLFAILIFFSLPRWPRPLSLRCSAWAQTGRWPTGRQRSSRPSKCTTQPSPTTRPRKSQRIYPDDTINPTQSINTVQQWYCSIHVTRTVTFSDYLPFTFLNLHKNSMADRSVDIKQLVRRRTPKTRKTWETSRTLENTGSQRLRN